MAENDFLTLHGLLVELLPVLKRNESESDLHKKSLEALQSELDFVQDASSGDTFGFRRNIFRHIAVCLNEARLIHSEALSEGLRILADASRERKLI